MKTTGGYTIIPLLDESGNDIEITTTLKQVKTGTFKKILRAIKYQKAVYFTGVILTGSKICTAGNLITFLGNYTIDYFVIPFSYVTSSGSVGVTNVRLNANDTIVAAALT